MDIPTILNLPNNQLKLHIDVLADDYKNRTGRTVCRSCASDIQQMITTLKQEYKMTNFELKKPQVIYKIEKGKGFTISNDTMTDELAIYFLKVNPDRIELFSKYPENWKELIGLENEEVEENVNEETSIKKVVETPAVKSTKTNKKGCTGCKDKSATKRK